MRLEQPRWKEFWQVWEERTSIFPGYAYRLEEEWQAAKAPLLWLFGGLTLVGQVEAAVSESEANHVISMWACHLYDRIVAAAGKNPLVWEGVYAKGLADRVAALVGRLTTTELISGRLTGPIPALPVQQQSGMKLGKLLKVYLESFGYPPKVVEWAVQDFSVLLGKLRPQKATVVVSLDPLDFLLASESTTGWSSCHGLDGCHRSGNLAYLCDCVTAIAYAYLDEHDWNGLRLPKKLWRQWVFIDVDEGVAYFQRQYPHEKEEFSAVARRLVAHALAKAWGVEPNWTVKRYPDREDAPLTKGSLLLYLDPTSAVIKLKAEGVGVRPLRVGIDPPCPVCDDGYISEGNLLTCVSCASQTPCYACGRWLDEDELLAGADGEPYCQDCWSERFFYCYSCGEPVWHEDGCQGADDEWYCETCWSDRFYICKYCGHVIWVDDAPIGLDGYPYCNDCYYLVFDECERCGETFWLDELIAANGAYYCEACYDELTAKEAV